MPRETWNEKCERVAKEISDYLHKNYAGQTVSKAVIFQMWNLGNVDSTRVAALLPSHNIEVKYGVVKPL